MPPKIAASLGASVVDENSGTKARVAALCLINFLCYRAVFESFMHQYSNIFPTAESMQRIIITGTTLFESIVESYRNGNALPEYVDQEYFTKWRRRYEEAVLQEGTLSFADATLDVFMKHATFTYLEEPRVITPEDNLWDFGCNVYRSYVELYKDYLGDEVLQG